MPIRREMVADLLLLAQEAGIGPGMPAGKSWTTPRRPAAAFVRRHLPWAAPWRPSLLMRAPAGLRSGAAEAVRRSLPPPLGPAIEPPATPPEKGGSAAAAAERREAPAGPSRAAGKATCRRALAAEPGRADGSAESPAPARRRRRAVADRLDPRRLRRWARRRATPAKSIPGDMLAPGALCNFRHSATAAGLAPVRRRSPGCAPAAKATAGRGAWAAVRASGLPGIGRAAEPASKHTGTADRRRPGRRGGGFSSLAAACGAAVNGDVIELQFDGRREEQPHPAGQPAGDDPRRRRLPAGDRLPAHRARSGQVSAQHVTTACRTTDADRAWPCELQVPREVPADQWSLVETRGDQVVRLEKCALSIDNASEQLGTYHQDVAFVRTRAAPGADTVVDDGTAAPIPPADDRTGRLHRPRRGRLPPRRRPPAGPPLLEQRTAGHHRAAALGRRRHADAASRRGTAGRSAAPDRGGAGRLVPDGQQPERTPSPAACNAPAPIRSCWAGPAARCWSRSAKGEVDDFRRQHHLDGRPQLLRRLRRLLVDRPQRGGAPPERMDFSAWKSHWAEQENLPRSGPVRWRKLPAADQPLHCATPADFALKGAAAANPAVGAASDGGNIGFQADRLPLPAAKPAAPKEKEQEPSRPAGVNLTLNLPLKFPVSRVDGGRFAFYAGVSRVALPGD